MTGGGKTYVATSIHANVTVEVQGSGEKTSVAVYPDPREDLESRSPNLGPYTTKGTLEEPPH